MAASEPRPERIMLPRLGNAVGHDARGAWTKAPGEPRIYSHEHDPDCELCELNRKQWTCTHG